MLSRSVVATLLLIVSQESNSFYCDNYLRSITPAARIRWPSLDSIPLLRRMARTKRAPRMEGEIASEVRSPPRGEPPRLYFGDDPTPRSSCPSPDGSSPRPAPFPSPRTVLFDAWLRLRLAARATFLPVGYPASVPPEYLSFQLWNVLQDLTSSLRSILATQVPRPHNNTRHSAVSLRS